MDAKEALQKAIKVLETIGNKDVPWTQLLDEAGLTAEEWDEMFTRLEVMEKRLL